MELIDILRQALKHNEEIYSVVGVVTAIDENKRTCTVQPSNGDAELHEVRLQTNVSGSVGLVQFPKIQSEVTISFFTKDLSFIAQTSIIDKIVLKIEGFELTIDKENFNNIVKNTNIESDNYEVKAKNTKFTAEQTFEVISQSIIKMQAENFILQATAAFCLTAQSINLTGITTITGATTIAGALSVSGGAISLGGSSNGGLPKGAALVTEINKIKTDFQNLKARFTNWSPVPNDGGAALKAQVSSWSPNVTPVTQTAISNPNVTQ
ncbi:hypothetical protein [Flavobacterium phage FPSV-S1]|nr:hypothetical protein [Flavobacterium phage FPSV-S1]QCW20490.1 hypothetical protein [Flavobacterium phage FPSV-S8]QCW20653.1 hypothetical protein [Flavobacterium phage FPSV-S27]